MGYTGPMLDRLQTTTLRGAEIGLCIVRVGFGMTLSLSHGVGKLGKLESFTDKVAAQGIWLAEVTAPAAAVSEALGGLLLALGLFTRPAAVFVVATMLVAAFVAHAGDPFSRRELALAYACLGVALAVAGPGRFSLDGLWRAHRRGGPA